MYPISSETSKFNWLSLSETADFLGIHPSTLRRWSDEGYIKCSRTPGGHRRFSEKDIQSFLKDQEQPQKSDETSDAFVKGLLAQTRQEIMTQKMETQTWYAAFSEHDRDAHRDSGRMLLGLILQYVLRTSGREPILEQAAKIGKDYGYDAEQRGLSLAEMVRAFFFFRETLLRSMRPGLITRGKYDVEDVHIHRSLREILDHVLFAALEGYETKMLADQPRN